MVDTVGYSWLQPFVGNLHTLFLHVPLRSSDYLLIFQSDTSAQLGPQIINIPPDISYKWSHV